MRFLLGVSVAVLLPALVGAQSPGRPTATATRRNGPISLDGRLDEPAWAAATPVTQFIQQKPNEGAPPSEKTEVRFLYDEDAVYIGARMFESGGASAVKTQLVRHDDSPVSDILRIDFDPYHGRLHSVEFDVNPSSWRGDANDFDRSWDPVWQAASRIDSLGWTTEIRIPFSQLRFSRADVQTWGLNITRITNRNQERDLWAFWKQNQAGGPSFFGDLTGMQVRGSTRHAELLPYIVGRTKRLGSADPTSPFYKSYPTDFRVGADAKVLLNNSLTLSATVNPDFGQVEVDPAVVNLGAYETFFPERRPFFVEGSDLFSFGRPGCDINCGLGLDLFYSRRIGRAPQGAGLAYSAGTFADVPEATDILGAAKLTGRTPSGYSLGAMDAVSRRETAEVQTASGSRLFVPVEPLTNSFISRGKKEMRAGNFTLGGIVTSVDRRLDNAGLRSLLAGSERAAGADADYYWLNHTYHWYGAVSGSRATGDSLAIARLERSSARYFQRPDRREVLYNSAATSLGGYGAITRFAKQSGTWQGDINAAEISPGFDSNELGFLQTADWRWANTSFGPVLTKPTRFYRTLTLFGNAEQSWNYDGDVTASDVTGFLETTLPSYWSIVALTSRGAADENDHVTRGGPVVREAGTNLSILQVGTDPRKRVVLSAQGQYWSSDDGGWGPSANVSATFHPAPNVTVTLGPNVSRRLFPWQFVTSVADPTATNFFGRRYVFAHIDQRQVSMTARVNATFTPSLSLDVFAQPLIASGDYSHFEEYAGPRQEKKLVYGKDIGTIQKSGDGTQYTIDPDGTGPAAPFTISNPNFNFRSLRGTSVLRWEWRPGSTAYLVWTQTRSGSEPFGDLSFSRDRQALFALPADNIFVLKISYWLGR